MFVPILLRDWLLTERGRGACKDLSLRKVCVWGGGGAAKVLDKLKRVGNNSLGEVFMR